MSALKPLAGPYRYEPQKAGHLPGFIKSASGHFIAECSDAHGPLLATAPELLAALKNLVAKVQLMTDDVGLGEELAAIAKAEGRK